MNIKEAFMTFRLHESIRLGFHPKKVVSHNPSTNTNLGIGTVISWILMLSPYLQRCSGSHHTQWLGVCSVPYILLRDTQSLPSEKDLRIF